MTAAVRKSSTTWKPAAPPLCFPKEISGDVEMTAPYERFMQFQEAVAAIQALGD